MKIIYSDKKNKENKVKTEDLDDLWYLSNIIDIGDIVRGKTLRKIKIGKEGDRKQNIAKKQVNIAIRVEKIEFHKYSNNLRVLGSITEGPEDVQKGSHHSFNIDENTTITIIKEKWLKFQQDKLKESTEKQAANILICVMDREEAYFALLKKQGYKLLTHIKGTVQKKEDKEKVKSTFYDDLIKTLDDYVGKYKIGQIILASNSFWKEDMMKLIKEDELRKKITLATCSSVDKTAINEVLKRPELKEALKKDRISKELKLVEEILREISKNGKASYGLKEVKSASDAGAIKILTITDSFIRKKRETEKYEEIDKLLHLVESMKAEIHIISSDNDAGKKLDGLGGVAALLRYKLSYN